MSLNICFSTDSIWADVSGPVCELQSLLSWIASWSSKLSPRGDSRALCVQTPTGLKVLVGALLQAREQGLFDIGERYPTDDSPERLREAGILRDYQAEAVRKALDANLGRGIIEAACGGGKTRIAAAIAACAGGDWLYLVTNKELAAQSATEFRELLPEMRKITGKEASLRAMNYGGVKELRERVFAGVIVDECHALAAITRSTQYANVSAERRIGMSGTPLDRQDSGNSVVIGLLGPVICHVGTKELVDKGYLARGRVVPIPFVHRARTPQTADQGLEDEGLDDEGLDADVIMAAYLVTQHL
jgi:superfamily II DNA or RNA helicase